MSDTDKWTQVDFTDGSSINVRKADGLRRIVEKKLKELEKERIIAACATDSFIVKYNDMNVNKILQITLRSLLKGVDSAN